MTFDLGQRHAFVLDLRHAIRAPQELEATVAAKRDTVAHDLPAHMARERRANLEQLVPRCAHLDGRQCRERRRSRSAPRDAARLRAAEDLGRVDAEHATSVGGRIGRQNPARAEHRAPALRLRRQMTDPLQQCRTRYEHVALAHVPL
jgi:hypothetical protein